MSHIPAALATRVRELRIKRGLSQAEAAALAGIDQGEWSRIENGKVNPRLSSLLGMERALGLDTLESLLGEQPSRSLAH